MAKHVMLSVVYSECHI